MTYLVHGPDGVPTGPADLATLQAWAREGRVSPETWLLEQPTGREVRAADLPLAPGVLFCPRCGFRDMAGQIGPPPTGLLTGKSLWDYALGLTLTLLLLGGPALFALLLPGSASLGGAMLWLVVAAVPATIVWAILRPFPRLKRGVGAGLLATVCSLPLLFVILLVAGVKAVFSGPLQSCFHP